MMNEPAAISGDDARSGAVVQRYLDRMVAHDWDAMDRLHEKGYISDPKSRAKSVVVTAEGVKRSRKLFEKHFGKKEPDAGQR